MWDKAFSTEMLIDGAEIAVNCPDEDLEREIAAILTAFGRTYPNGGSLLKDRHWKQHEESFCYYVEGNIVCSTRGFTLKLMTEHENSRYD